MNKQSLISDIKSSINKRKEYLISKMPLVHTINDGIIIRFFNGWNDSEHKDVKYINITNENQINTKAFYFFLPKGSIFDVREHKYEEQLICLDGKIQLHYNDNIKILNSFSRFNVPSNTKHYGIALDNTYMVVISE